MTDEAKIGIGLACFIGLAYVGFLVWQARSSKRFNGNLLAGASATPEERARAEDRAERQLRLQEKALDFQISQAMAKDSGL